MTEGVTLSLDETLDRLLPLYERHFDIERDNSALLGETVPAVAHFFSRGERYVLTKRAKLWGVECNEYIFFFTTPRLTEEEVDHIAGLIIRAEPELVSPHSEHMYTYLSAVILAEEITPGAARRLRRMKWRRSYRFSLMGWCHLRLAAKDIVGEEVITNRDGKELKKVLKQITTPVDRELRKESVS